MTDVEWYRRIEPLPPYGDLDRGFATEVADPVWFLARQWRHGELLAEDAGTPVVVTVDAAHVPLDPLAGLDPSVVPAEALVEGTPADWWTPGRRVRVGRAIATGLTTEQRAACGFRAPLPEPYGDSFRGEVDGLRAWTLGLVPDDAPALAGFRGAAGADRPDPWQPATLDHALDLSAGGGGLAVREHRGGDVDWWTADATAAPTPPAAGAGRVRRSEVLPQPLRFPGAPHPRLWQVEDARVDVGGYPPDRAHPVTALLIELVSSTANDWFLFPVPPPTPERLRRRRAGDPPGTGVVVLLPRVQVRDSFDDSWDLAPPPDWGLFGTAGLDRTALVLWPSAATALTGPVLDDVVLGVDEDADLLWAVELRAEGCDLVPDATSTGALEERRRTGTRAFTWQPSTTVPAHWHPYRIEPVDGRRAFVQGLVSTALGPDGVPGLRRGPRSALLGGAADGAAPEGSGHVLSPSAVPNAGLRLEARYALARGTDGRPVLWRQRRAVPLLGGPASHLRFDVLHEAPAPG